MAAIIKNKFRIKNAKDFIENLTGHPRGNGAIGNTINITEATEAETLATLQATLGTHVVDRNLYLFIGRPRPWPNLPTANPPVSELQPPLPKDTAETEARIWENMLGCKKITDQIASLVIPRRNWDPSGNTIYFQYDDMDGDLLLHPTNADNTAANLGGYTAGSHYIITDEFHLFKCLSNNNGAKSTDKPQKPLSSPYIFESGIDGYRWKYLTTITPSQILKFATDTWIPVKTLKADDGSTQWLVQQASLDGTIESFVLDSRGSGYQHVHSGTLSSATSNQGVLAIGSSNTDDVYNGAQIHITGGLGAGIVKDILDYDQSSRTVTVNGTWSVDNTSTYQIAPKIVLSGTGTGAIARPIVETSPGPDQYKIKSILVVNGGTGYRYATASITGAGGSGAIARPVISQVGGHGKDVENELGAYFVMLNVTLEYNEGSGDFPISNDYRQIGLIRDLKNYDGSLATENTRIATKTLNVQSVVSGLGGTFTADEIITGTLGGSIALAKVVDYISLSPTTGKLTIIQDEVTGYGTFIDTMAITSSISGATATISASGVINEEIKKFDGDIIYIDNKRPILRSPDQKETLRPVIEF